MPADKVNTVEVTLPLSVAFQYTTTDSYLAWAGQFANDVGSSNYARNGGATVDAYSSANGTFSFTLKPGVQATTLYIPIQFDRSINTDTVTNAVIVRLFNSDGEVSEVLGKVIHEADTGMRLATAYQTNSFLFKEEDQITPSSDRKVSARSYREMHKPC